MYTYVHIIYIYIHINSYLVKSLLRFPETPYEGTAY